MKYIFILSLLVTNIYAISWQHSQTQHGQPYANVPKHNIKLCIRDKNGELGSYAATFNVVNSNRDISSITINVYSDDFKCILYPNDFKNIQYLPGEYTWYTLVNNKKVINSKFTY